MRGSRGGGRGLVNNGGGQAFDEERLLEAGVGNSSVWAAQELPGDSGPRDGGLLC